MRVQTATEGSCSKSSQRKYLRIVRNTVRLQETDTVPIVGSDATTIINFFLQIRRFKATEASITTQAQLPSGYRRAEQGCFKLDVSNVLRVNTQITH